MLTPLEALLQPLLDRGVLPLGAHVPFEPLDQRRVHARIVDASEHAGRPRYQAGRGIKQNMVATCLHLRPGFAYAGTLDDYLWSCQDRDVTPATEAAIKPVAQKKSRQARKERRRKEAELRVKQNRELKPLEARVGLLEQAIARLEQAGKLALLVTQNVDGLHQRAGSSGVIEFHGNLFRDCCFDDSCEGAAGVDDGSATSTGMAPRRFISMRII